MVTRTSALVGMGVPAAGAARVVTAAPIATARRGNRAALAMPEFQGTRRRRIPVAPAEFPGAVVPVVSAAVRERLPVATRIFSVALRAAGTRRQM